MRIYLTGFMGSGKTHWGKIWAKESGLDFYDLDELIEKSANDTISNIFEKKGEQYFRELEASILRSTAHFEQCIIACGGGTPCFHENMQWMNEQGTSVYLKLSPELLLKNVMNERDKRPLFKNADPENLLAFIEEKLIQRSQFYEQAKLKLPVSELSEQTIHTILQHPQT